MITVNESDPFPHTSILVGFMDQDTDFVGCLNDADFNSLDYLWQHIYRQLHEKHKKIKIMQLQWTNI